MIYLSLVNIFQYIFQNIFRHENTLKIYIQKTANQLANKESNKLKNLAKISSNNSPIKCDVI